MIKRIDLFLPPNVSQYGVLNHFTTMLYEALQRLGVQARILTAERNNPKPFLSELFKDVPDCTLSFNGLLPDEEGRFFADLIRIPHVAYVVDSPNSYVSLATSPLTIIASVDQNACEFFKGIGAKNVLFMPHAVEKNLNFNPHDERTYNVVMLSSCIDYEAIQDAWKKNYPPLLAALLEEAAEKALTTSSLSYVQAFVTSMDKKMHEGVSFDPNKIDFIEALDQLEMYVRGRERVELVRSIKDAPIDIFGAPATTTSWKNQLKGQPNVTIHDEVPFDQALDIMKKSKIVLSSCAWIKKGLHERTLAALATGALPLAAGDNEFMQRNLADDKQIAYFYYSDLKKANEKVNHYLSQEELRKQVAHAGREQVMHHHTWDQRAAALVRELDPILKSIRN